MQGARRRIAIWRVLACLLILASCIWLLAACSRDTGEGKIFSYPLDAVPQRLDPAVAHAADEHLIINNVFEGLVRQDTAGEIIPGVAYSWTISDGVTYTFHLRDDSHWRPLEAQDDDFDTQVTAYDFEFGITRALLPVTNAPNAAALFAIKNARTVHEGSMRPEQLGVTAIDRFTLEITLEKPSAGFLYALTQSVAMPTNQAFFDATRGRYGLSAAHLLCNGPFYLNRWEGNHLRLRKNHDYSGHAPVAPATVNLFVQPNAAARLSTLGAEGGYDAAIVPAAYLWSLPEGAQVTRLYNATLAFIFRSDRAPLNDASLRTALCAALNTGELGFESPPGLLPDSMRVGGERLRSLVGSPESVAHDIARAQHLLGGAGTNRVSLTLICAPEHELLSRRALQQWQLAFGMDLAVSIEVFDDPEELARQLERGNFDIAVTSLQASSSFALQALEDWTQPGPGNPMRYESAQLRSILQAAGAEDPLEAAKACRDAEEHLLQNGVVYPLAPQASLLAVAPGVEGFAISPAGDRVFFGGMRK